MTTRTLSADDQLSVGHEQTRSGHDRSALPYGLLLAFIFLIFATPALLVPSLDILRPTEIIGIAAIATLILDMMLSKSSFVLPRVQGYSLLAFVGIALLSAFSALWVMYSLERAVDLLRFTVIYVVLVNVVDRRSRLEGVITVMAVGGAIPALGALLTRYQPGERLGWVGIFENSNDLAFAMVILVPLAAILVTRGSRLWQVGGLLLFASFVATVFATSSRGGLIGLVAAVLVLALRARRNSFRVMAVVFVVATLLFVSVFWSRAQGFSDLANDATLVQRIHTIEAGLNMWMDRPLLGIGLGCSAIGWPLYAPPGAYAEHWLHNHNTFVQVMSETGTFGILFFGAVVLSTLSYLRRLRLAAMAAGDARMTTIAGGLEASTWGLLVCGMSGGYLLSWFPYLVFGLAGAAHLLPTVEPTGEPGEAP